MFDLGTLASTNPDAALTLLWNSVAFCTGRAVSDNRKPSGWDYGWQSWHRDTWQEEPHDRWVPGPLSANDLKLVYHWMGMLSEMNPSSAAAEHFSTIGSKIMRAVGDVGEPSYLRHDEFGRYRDGRIGMSYP